MATQTGLCALITTATFLTATNAFAMSEQAKGSLDAANHVYYYGVVNKYCKFMTKAEFKANFAYITEFALEYRAQYPDYDMGYTGFADRLNANLATATKANLKKYCKEQKPDWDKFYIENGQWDD